MLIRISNLPTDCNEDDILVLLDSLPEIETIDSPRSASSAAGPEQMASHEKLMADSGKTGISVQLPHCLHIDSMPALEYNPVLLQSGRPSGHKP